jgi:hypothetical protein
VLDRQAAHLEVRQHVDAPDGHGDDAHQRVAP